MKGSFFFIDAERFIKDEEGTYPLVDFLLTDDDVYILAEVPGIDRESLDIKIDSGIVEIRGVKREPSFFSNATHFYKLESFYGCFSRKIVLPVSVVGDKARIFLGDGVLRICIPRLKQTILEIPVE